MITAKTETGQVQLEKMALAFQQMISDEILLDTSVKLHRFSQDMIIEQVRIWVWAKRDDMVHQHIKYPADWWQAFKERWFPKWLIESYPIRYKVIDLDVRELYPRFKPALPDEERVLTIIRRDSGEIRFAKDTDSEGGDK